MAVHLYMKKERSQVQWLWLASQDLKQFVQRENLVICSRSIIRIEKDKLDHLLNEWGDGDVIKRLMNQITELDLGIELKEFYEIKEHSIRQINEKKLKDMTKDELILQIREEAIADKYNKISGSLAERIVNALLKIQKEREE